MTTTTPAAASPFDTVPLRPRFFQSSSFFPMPIVLLATRCPDGGVNLAPYSLCFPVLEADPPQMVLLARATSKTVDNLERTGRVSVNFIPDDPALLANCRLLSQRVPTADKMKQSAFHTVPSPAGDAARGRDGSEPPPLVSEAIQVFECRVIAAETVPASPSAIAAGDAEERRFTLEVEAIRMQPRWRDALENKRRGPRMPVDYGRRGLSDAWMAGPGVQMSGPRLRPRFTAEVDKAPEVVLAEFKAALARPDAPVVGNVRGLTMQLGLPEKDVTTWSPGLDISLTPTERGTSIYGRIGPQPAVWTAFMFTHLLILMFGIAGLMWGIAQSMSGGSPWAFWFLPTALFLHLFVAGAAFIGQGLGADQTHRLRSFIDDVLSS